jgi:hypothetical protein
MACKWETMAKAWETYPPKAVGALVDLAGNVDAIGALLRYAGVPQYAFTRLNVPIRKQADHVMETWGLALWQHYELRHPHQLTTLMLTNDRSPDDERVVNLRETALWL